MISLIVAMAAERVIGNDNAMPWHLPADLAWFKQHTINKPVIMGRKTFQSIGRALPQRTNIVVSSQPFSRQIPDVHWVSDPQQALSVAGDAAEIMVIGGGNIYQQMLPLASRLYLTHIDTEIDGDTQFPEFDSAKWITVFSQFREKDPHNAHNVFFEILERRQQY